MHLSRLVGSASLVTLAAGLAGAAGASQSQLTPPPFTGSAAAYGVSVRVTVADAPVTDTPIDGGGPTTQAALSSLGAGTGYAAFPDPGSLIVSVPGLIAGFLSIGAGPVPPTELPTLPGYPLYVQADASKPEARIGDGPFSLRARVDDSEAVAEAVTGIRTGAAGNLGLATSDSSVRLDDGSVVAEAVSDVQSVTIGPLTIGQVRTMARQELAAGGAGTQASSIDISGVKVGGLAVSVDGAQLVAGGVPAPLPLNDLAAQALESSGMSLTLVGERRFPDRVIAPAIEITAPFSASSFGFGDGTFTLVVGGATASLSSATAAIGTPELPLPSTGLGPGGTAPSPAPTAPVVAPAANPALAGGVAGTGSVASPAAAGVQAAVPATSSDVSGPFDISSLYLVVGSAGAAAWAIGQVIRYRRGARSWTPFAG